MENIVSFSGGKDSTAMLLMMLEKNIPVDDIVFCDTGKEFPEMYKHIKKVEDYIGRRITIIKAEKTFDYYMFDHVKTRGKNKGKCGYGWATMRARWCTGFLKRDVLRHYMKGRKYINYVGIAYDEVKRHEICPDNTIHPLYNWCITEKMALQYCYNHGFTWGGLYEHFNRVSCWCCPLKNNKELLTLYLHYPKLWQELKDMDNKAYNKFKSKGIDFYEKKFRSIEKGANNNV